MSVLHDHYLNLVEQRLSGIALHMFASFIHRRRASPQA
jgi:hypothetical protein